MLMRLTLKFGALLAACGTFLGSLVRRITGKNFIRKQSEFMKLPHLPKWRRSQDIFLGHEPNFKIHCRICGEEMFCRYTAAIMDRVIMRSGNRACNELAYKCPECALVWRFIVPDSKSYIKKMLKMRKGIVMYYPPVTVWAKINDKIRRQLAALGYVGGMEVEEPETQVLSPGS